MASTQLLTIWLPAGAMPYWACRSTTCETTDLGVGHRGRGAQRQRIEPFQVAGVRRAGVAASLHTTWKRRWPKVPRFTTVSRSW